MTVLSLVGAGAADHGALRAADPAMPGAIEAIRIDEKRGDKINLDLPFRAEDGSEVRLREVFDGKPVLLTFNYSDCPMLCSVQLNGFLDGLKELKWSIGKEFNIVTIGLDPKETPEKIQATKTRYLMQYERPDTGRGWRFFTGDEVNVRALANSVGFGYGLVKETGEYAHAPAVMVVTPEGIVSRYLYGVAYDPKTLRLSLVEAAAGRLGTPLDQILLYCFHYDPQQGKYTPVVQNIMRVGGALTVLTLGLYISGGWLWGRRRRVKQPHGTDG